MRNFARWVALVAFAGVVFLLLATAALLLAAWTEWMPPMLPGGLVLVFVLAILGVPATVAVWAARALARRWLDAEPPGATARSRRLAWIVGAAYLVTAIFGVPAVLSDQTSWAVTEYKRVKASGSKRVWEGHPRIWNYAAIPVAPGLILTYHEYQLDALYGFGGFELTLWYGIGVRRLLAMPIWLS